MNDTVTEKRYEINKSIKGIMTFGLAFFSLGLLGSIIMCFVEPRLMLELWWIWIPVIIGYLIFVKVIYSAWKERNHFITMDDNSINVNSEEGQIESLKWSEIMQIKESLISKRITLIGKYHKIVKLEYQLENFHELIINIIDRMEYLKESLSKYRKFHKTNQPRIVFGIFFLVLLCFTYFSMKSNEIFPGVFFAALSIGSLYPLIKEFTTIYVTDSHVIIKYPLSKKTIERSEIKEVILENTKDQNGESFPVINLKLKNFNNVKLSGVREGTIPLYCSLKNIVIQDS